MDQWILLGIIFEIILLIIFLFFVLAFGKKMTYEKGVLHNQICDIENRLDHIRNIVDACMNDIVSVIDEKDVKILENNELMKRDILGNISELKIYIESNFVKSEKEKRKECQELKETLIKVYKGNEAVRQNMSTMEEIFRLQLVNGLLNDADKAITDCQK